MPIKLTYEFIEKSFEKEGYELLSEEYINAHSKLRYRCPKGHKHSITWANWQQEHRCPYCTGHSIITVKFIRSEFEKEGYTLLTTEYVDNKQKLDYICLKGHRHSISWANWIQEKRCPYCEGNIKLTLEFIRSEFEKDGYILLTKEYKNSRQKLDYVCPEGHKHFISWCKWYSGRRCPYCARVVKPTIEFIRSGFEKEDYRLLAEEYKNNRQKLDYICPKGHKHNISWANWKSGYRCPYCVITASKGEIQVRNFIKSLGIKVSANNRNQIFNSETGNGLELDIFMPDFNKAIEYNGEYWHQDKTRDLLKQQLCKYRNIDLLTIWDKEWKTQKNVCEDKIMKFMF